MTNAKGGAELYQQNHTNEKNNDINKNKNGKVSAGFFTD